jgi:hypothetical protein
VNQLKTGRAQKALHKISALLSPLKPKVLKFPKRTNIVGFEAMEATELSVVDRFFV